ncbi:MAG: DUF4040 domain-containing protein [Anaerolineales bacterium]|nr:DUF4040 domain-containing protein [Anaerolineales bacterium]
MGAFTKSAQFPFHFWLPGAMSAPTPASAYLHSATMVKAGVYLLARFHPALSDSPLWFWSLLIVGGVTMVFGAVTAIRYTDMKAILAYTTISALGTATALLAFNSEMAAVGVTVTILAHALYKAPLFLTAGTVDHAVGTRDLRFLAGLWRPLPVVALTGMLAALSMAGVPPTWGFLAKELLLEQFYDVYGAGGQWLGAIGYGAAVTMGIFTGGAVFALIWEAFLRSHADEPEPAHVHHKPSFWFALPALILAALGAFTALFIGWLEPLVVAPAQAILGAPLHKHLALWHGWTFVLITSLGILAAAVIVAAGRRWVRRAFAHTPPRLSGVYVYDTIVDGVYRFAYRLTRVVQGGPMAPQITVTLMAAVAVLGYAVFKIDLKNLTILDSVDVPLIPEILIFLVAIVAAVATVRSRSRLSAIISLGVVGVAVTLFFIFYSAPDLALTQLLIEVLTVVLLVLVFFRVKPDRPIGRDNRIILRLVVSVLVGFFGFAIVMFNHIYQVAPSISPYFIANSLPLGQGANVVNVILVDIRGYDTMGEITVLTLAALGGYAVIRSPQVSALRQRLAGLSRARKQDAANKPAGAGDD